MKKKHFLQKCLQTPGCKQTEQYETTRILWHFYQDMQNTSNKLFVDCKKMIIVFFFQRIICKINQAREDGVFCSITES